jgi:hypothetical protein
LFVYLFLEVGKWEEKEFTHIYDLVMLICERSITLTDNYNQSLRKDFSYHVDLTHSLLDKTLKEFFKTVINAFVFLFFIELCE